MTSRWEDSFERGSLVRWSVFGAVQAAVSGTVANSGVLSLEEKGDAGVVFRDIGGLTPGQVYRVAARARSSPGAARQALLFAHDTTGANVALDGWRTPSSAAWDEFGLNFTATASGKVRVHLYTTGGAGSLYWDDVAVSKAAP